jgi:thiol-disulfide isomerase/thioredoxin
VAAAIAKGKASGKRILVQVGGNWCGWCYRLHQYFNEQPAVAKALDDGFEVVLVNFSDENRNQASLGQYPPFIGYPHLFVLDSDGTLLHSHDTGELEAGDSYNQAKVLAFLSDWKK